MSGKRSRDKGGRVEREIVKMHQGEGIEAERVPLSGGAGGSFSGDINITTDKHAYKSEVKARANGQGFTVIEQWLGKNDILFLKRDRQKPFVCMNWQTYIKLMKGE